MASSRLRLSVSAFLNRLRFALARVGQTPAGKNLELLQNELNTLIAHWPEPETRETGTRKLIPTDETGRYWLVTTLSIAQAECLHQLELL